MNRHARTHAAVVAPAEPGPDLEFGEHETLRYQRPELPPLSEVSRYYALSEEARFYSNGGPCYERLSSRLAAYVGDVTCVPVGNCTRRVAPVSASFSVIDTVPVTSRLCDAPKSS